MAMDSTQTIQKIIEDIRGAEVEGARAIDTKRLISYLDSKSKELENVGTVSEAQLEEYRAINAGKLAQYNWRKDVHLEMLRSVLTSGQSALRAQMLLHGGAALALLTFIGHLIVKPETQPIVIKFAPIMMCFLIGVLLSVICHGITYVGQYCYQRDLNTLGHICNLTSNVSAVCGYGLFGWACYLSYQALLEISTYYTFL